MSSLSPVPVADPLILDVVTTQQPGSGSAGAVAVKESAADVGGAEASRIVLAIACANDSAGNQGIEQLAADTVLASLSEGEGTAPDEAAALKQAFRAANGAVYQRLSTAKPQDHAGLSLAALITNDKYATIAVVGEMRGYLARAERLNQVTRDQRVAKPQSRRGQQASAKEEKEPVRGGQLIGEQERLDSRLPAIFELSLLPQDRVLLANSAVYDVQPDEQLFSIIRGFDSDANARSLMVPASQERPMLAAVVKAESSRPVTYAPAPPVEDDRRVLVGAVVITILVLIVLVAAYFYLPQ